MMSRTNATAPSPLTESELLKLPRKALAERCWAAEANAEAAGDSAGEAWTEVAKLRAILEDDKLTEAVRVYIRLKAHDTHVRECRTGSCEDEFRALVTAGLAYPHEPKPSERRWARAGGVGASEGRGGLA